MARHRGPQLQRWRLGAYLQSYQSVAEIARVARNPAI